MPGYTGSPTPYFPYVAPLAPEPPEHGKWPVAAAHTTVKDLLAGIQVDNRGLVGLGLGAGKVGRTVEKKWEQRLNYALFDAAARGDCGLVASALGQKADPNVKVAASGVTPLHLAAVEGNSPEAIRVLYMSGATLDVVDFSNTSPLLGSLQAGHGRSAMSLMLLRADPSQLLESESRRSALNAVLQHCPPDPGKEYVKLTGKLLKVAAGPPSSASGSPPVPPASGFAAFFGGGPAAPAASSTSDDVETQMRVSVLVCVANSWTGGLVALLAAGADPSCLDHKSRRSALELADALLNDEVASILRSYGAEDMNPPRQDHACWALCLAACRGDWDVAVEWGGRADLDWRETPPSDRNTALHYAAIEGHGDIARLLVEAGHSVDLLNTNALSPATLARKRGHHALANYLQQLEMKSHWKRAEALSKGRPPSVPEDYMPKDNERGEDGRSWPVLYNLLMPPAGDEVAWREHSRPVIEEASVRKALTGKVDPTRLHVIILSCNNLEPGSFNWSLDPFVKVKLGSQTHNTPVLSGGGKDPVFNFAIDFHSVKERDVVTCNIFDQDMSPWAGEHIDHDLLGRIDVPLFKHRNKMLAGGVVRLTESLKHQSVAGKISTLTLSMKFASKEDDYVRALPERGRGRPMGYATLSTLK